MTSAILSERYGGDAFLIAESPNNLSRQGGLIDNSSAAFVSYEAGLVVSLNAGALTTGTGSAAKPVNVGNGSIGAVTQGAGVQFGTYVLTANSATDFGVVAPSGDALPDATVGNAYTGPIGFTIVAGNVAFAPGDVLTVAVSQTAANSWSSWTGGSFTQLGILADHVDVNASSAARVAVLVRKCEVNVAELQWDPSVLASANVATLQASAIAALSAANIDVR